MKRVFERGAVERARALVRACLASLLLIAAMPASADPTVLMVELGTQRLHRAAGDVSRVAVGDPAIADVSVVNRRELLITGKGLGITSLHVWTRGAPQPSTYRVRVGAVVDPTVRSRPDPELSQAMIDQGRSVSGKLPNLLAHRRAAQAGKLAEAGTVTDSSGIELETQVMTTVKIAEVGRSTMRRYGLHASKASGSDSGGLFAPGSLSGVEQNSGDSSGIEFLQSLPIQNAFNLVLADPGRGLLGIISLLEGKGLVRVLAEPSLLAMSGQTATYLAGGEFPVPVSQGGASAGGISIQYKEFGVRLAISPTVLARNRIAMKVAPEVSDLDFSAGIQIGGVAVPALSVRRTETTIELGDGETFVISGLVSSNLADSVNKVPWLGDIPILGAFFKSNDLQRQDRELIMVVTPQLVRPLAKGATLPKLPGSEYDRYAPSAAQTIFLERGDFDSGFSR
jgi:pilus assembly protein CpaC